MTREYIHLKIKRQDNPDSAPYWEEFKVPYKPNMNVVSVLMEIRKNPVNANGQKTTPVVWECNCLEEVCGACSMRINGVPRQACSALIDKIDKSPIILEPLSKFPVIRDLQIDRQIMFDYLKKVKAWVNVDGSWDLGPGPLFPEKTRQWAYQLSRCMTCGCCLESCPNYNEKSAFIGPQALNQVRLFNAHPIGKMDKEKRLDAIMGPGGITECGNAQNCAKACPKEIPLTVSIADLNKQTVLYGLKRWLYK
ncbi:MAG: succinate dehydrogenase iron-sulfur subunit [Thermoanaerobacteraceae bacterium]|nr:succinate dehydrogenase iron-sulfur subunit [Thermoanaerobacteraceae bacterium]